LASCGERKRGEAVGQGKKKKMHIPGPGLIMGMGREEGRKPSPPLESEKN